MPVLGTLTPIEAYAADLDRGTGGVDARPRIREGAAVAWVVLAGGLRRIAQAGGVADPEIAITAASLGAMLEAFAVIDGFEPRDDVDWTEPRAANDADSLRQTARALRAGIVGHVFRSVRACARDMADANLLHLAYATLEALRGAYRSGAVHVEHALALLDQGTVARLAGDLERAGDHYEAAATLAGDDPSVAARAHLGRGALARMRGNTPAARRAFMTGLRLAEAAGLEDAVAAGRQGLLAIAAGAGQLDDALAHGAALVRMPALGARRRAEVHVNLAALALDLGYPRAALAGALAALGTVATQELRMGAAGTAIVAAARLGLRSRVLALGRYIEQSGAAAEYHWVGALYAASVAYRMVGERNRAEFARARAHDAARAQGYAEWAELTYPSAPDERVPAGPRPVGPGPAAALRYLESLDTGPGEAVLASA